MGDDAHRRPLGSEGVNLLPPDAATGHRGDTGVASVGAGSAGFSAAAGGAEELGGRRGQVLQLMPAVGNLQGVGGPRRNTVGIGP